MLLNRLVASKTWINHNEIISFAMHKGLILYWIYKIRLMPVKFWGLLQKIVKNTQNRQITSKFWWCVENLPQILEHLEFIGPKSSFPNISPPHLSVQNMTYSVSMIQRESVLKGQFSKFQWASIIWRISLRYISRVFPTSQEQGNEILSMEYYLPHWNLYAWR